MAELTLTGRERATLLELIDTTTDVRLLRRAYAILWLDDGELVTAVAEQLNVSRPSVYNWCERFTQRQGLPLVERLRDADRAGRPATVQGSIDPLLDRVIETDPRHWGYRATVWAVPVLMQYLADQHQLLVAAQSVRLALARLKIHWKRPRHRLALRSATWQQAKGG
jgi:transposase